MNSQVSSLLPEVLVIGGGVMGLSCALRIRQLGYPVRVWAEHFPPHTTSNVAPAFWHPYRVYPAERVQAWAIISYQEFARLAQDPHTGVVQRQAYEFLRHSSPIPLWHSIVENFRVLNPSEIFSPYQDGYYYQTYVIDTSQYLPWLMQQAAQVGVLFATQTLRSLESATHQAAIVINCSGLGAASLVPDPSMLAVRGQILRVANPGIDCISLDEQHPAGTTYIVPRGEDCILGGTSDENQWDFTPHAATTEAILQRCQALEPRLQGIQVYDVAVGLRPCRPSVCLEAERAENGTYIIHNYGHGGGGITLSWGCAQAVLQLLTEHRL